MRRKVEQPAGLSDAQEIPADESTAAPADQIDSGADEQRTPEGKTKVSASGPEDAESSDDDNAEPTRLGTAHKVAHLYLCRNAVPTEATLSKGVQPSIMPMYWLAIAQRQAAEKEREDEAIREQAVHRVRTRGITGPKQLCSLVSAMDSPILRVDRRGHGARYAGLQQGVQHRLEEDPYFPRCNHHRRSVVVGHSAEPLKVKTGNAKPEVLDHVSHDTTVRAGQ